MQVMKANGKIPLRPEQCIMFVAGALLLSSIDTAINIMGLEAYYMQVIRGGLD